MVANKIKKLLRDCCMELVVNQNSFHINTNKSNENHSITKYENSLCVFKNLLSRNQKIVRENISIVKLDDYLLSIIKNREMDITKYTANHTKNHEDYVGQLFDRLLRDKVLLTNRDPKVHYMTYCPKGVFLSGKIVEYNEHTKLVQVVEDYNPKYVFLENSFWISQTTITQDVWEFIMGWNHSFYVRNDGHIRKNGQSITNITWYDCLDFCNKLSVANGLQECYELRDLEYCGLDKEENDSFLNVEYQQMYQRNEQKNVHIKSAKVFWNKNANGYRLPTSYEWEYAAKANRECTYSSEYFAIDTYKKATCSVFYENDDNVDIQSGIINDWGLYLMSSGISEWCFGVSENVSTNLVQVQKKLDDGYVININPIENMANDLMVFKNCKDFDSEKGEVYGCTFVPKSKTHKSLGFRVVRNANKEQEKDVDGMVVVGNMVVCQYLL